MSFSDLIASTDRACQTHLGGVPVTYTPAVGSAVTVMGMFDENYLLIDRGNSGVEQVVPSVLLRLEDLPLHPDSDTPTITISSVAYTVKGRETDGEPGGSIRLHLRKVT